MELIATIATAIATNNLGLFGIALSFEIGEKAF
jgi:hypothetical protein